MLVGGLAAGYTLGMQASPLGVPLPSRPKPVVIDTQVEIKDSNVVARRISSKVLQLLAPQPDGTPPLDLWHRDSRSGFKFALPFGSQSFVLPDEIYNKNHLDMQVTFKYGLPFFLLNIYRIQRTKDPSFQATLERIRRDIPHAHAKVGNIEESGLETEYHFMRFSYTELTPDGWEQTSQVYVTPYGDYVLVFDFMSKTTEAKQGLALSRKILNSFSSSFKQTEILRPSDPWNARPANAGNDPVKP